MALMLSLAFATPAFADEAPPPPAPTEEAAEGQEPAPPSESAASESAPPEETVSEILEQLPSDTELVVVDENGEALPLASEAAEEAVLVKDPIWCPAGVAPKPGIGGCSSSFASLSALVAGFTPPAKNGVIWIEVGTDAGAEVVIDGLGAWAPAASYSLTLQGGWVGGTTGSTAIVGTTVFDTAISIVNWNGAVTLNDIVFDGANNTTFANAGSLYVGTSKNIALSNVVVVNSGAGDDGAYLNNTFSSAQASVTIKNSVFNDNTERGLTVFSDGAVTLTNVSVNSNGATFNGAYIDNNNDTAPSAVTVTKGFFNQNGVVGLEIISNGVVKLSQIVASFNSNDGVDVDNTTAPTPQAVTVSGFLTANNNGNYGLSIYSEGAVTLTNLTTNNNGVGGVLIDNSGATAAQAVTITGYNFMSGNSGASADGLVIYSKGAVTLNNITAGVNGDYGVYIDNTYGTAPAAVNIKGVNAFNDNGNVGLYVVSRGAINAYNVTANTNAYISNSVGVYLANSTDPTKPQNITLFGTNTMNNNGEGGLYILTYGAVTLNNLTAYGNGFDTIDSSGDGVRIINSGGTLARPVSLKGVNTFNNNNGSGLVIYSLGAVSVSNIAANSNGVYGAEIQNDFSLFQSAVTISGYGAFDNNIFSGLFIQSNGAVTTTNLSAQDNAGYGVYIDTIGITKPQAVNLKGNNTFISNGDAGTESGLVVYADGNITVNNLTANQNYYRGAYLDNFTNWDAPVVNFPTFGSIVVTGYGNFYNNGNDGLHTFTNGNVTLSYITASLNGDDGIQIITINAASKVTLTCVVTTQNDFGIYMNNPAATLTIKGLSASANTIFDAILSYVTLTRSRCTG